MAAYLVVLSHCRRLVEQSYFGEPGSASALRFLDAGSFGVVVFFALSGCTLYTSYGRQPLTGDSVARFMVRRLFRVYPAFLVSLPVYMLVDWLIRVGLGFPDGTWIATLASRPTLEPWRPI